MSKIYFLCSAESVADNKKIFGMDLPLSDKGMLQVIHAHKLFVNASIEKVISSSMLRAFMTAKEMFSEKNRFIVDKRFNEINFGAMEGLPMTNFAKKRISENIWNLKDTCKGDDVEERVKDALIALYHYAVSANNDIVLIAHDGIMECMLEKIGFTNEAIQKEGGFKFWNKSCKIPPARAFTIGKDSFCNAVRILYGK